MIPLKLTLKGIYSYIEEQTIEFNDLTDSGLFGIFGSVGSGKSTILEAITFALYGETERLNSRDSRAYNMMNLKSNELLIDFEFYTDSEDTRYRFIVKGKRNKKKFDEVKAFERSSFILTPNVKLVGSPLSQPSTQTDEWIPTEKTAYDIIGLNYPNFKRTIIIPQGKFREFLELKASERTNMLNEIFNLDRFDLAPKLAIIKTQNELELNVLLGKMEQYQELNSEILKNKKAAETYLLTQEKQERSELNKLQEDFISLNQLKELFASLNKTESEFKAISQSADRFDKRKKNLDIYIDCRVKFSQLLTSESSLHKEISQKSSQLQQLKKHLDVTTLKKDQLDGQLKQVKIIYDQKQYLIDETKELETIISIREAIKNKQILASRIEKGNLIINQQKLEYDQTQSTLQEQQLIQSQLKEQLPDISELNNVKNFYIKQADLDKRIEEVTAESKSLLSEIQLLTDSFNNNLQEQFSWVGDFKDKDKTIEAAREKIDIEIVNFKKTKKKLNDKLNHILTQEKLKQWADELVDGENCPLCGSKEHPEILNITDLENEILAIKKQSENVEKDITLHNDFLSKIEKVEYKLNLVNKSLDQKAIEKEQKKQQLLIHNKSFSFSFSFSFSSTSCSNYDSLESIEKFITSTEKSNEIIKKVEKIISKKTTELIELQQNVNKYSTAHQELKDQYTALDAGIENDVKKLKLLSLQQLESESDSSLINKSKSQKQQVKQAIEDFDSMTLDLSKIQSEVDKTQGQVKTLTELLNEKNTVISEVQKILQEKLLDSQYKDILEVVKILSNDLNEVEESQIISDFEAKLNIASKTLETLQIEIKGKEFNQEMFLIIKSQISNKELLLKELSSKIGVIQSEIKKLKVDLESKNKLNNEYNQLIKRKDNIQILSKLFKGQGFVRYISSVYLQNLSKSANERFFKMTRQQLQLEITQNPSSSTMDFQIRDFLNEGKTRSVKTLSGGQMFQASLSLALALADSVQSQIKASHRFFFLDEGFGSLDNESLHIVFEALKSLKTENRIVGVISHVESLKQEIDVHLQVNKNDERGSLVHYSWI